MHIMKYHSNIELCLQGISMRQEKLSRVIGLLTPSGSNLLIPWREVTYPLSAEAASPPPVVATLLPPSGRINYALPEEMVMASSCHARQYRFSLGPTSSSSLCFLTITRLKSSQEAPKGEVQSVLHEEVCYTTKELLLFSNVFRQKSR